MRPTDALPVACGYGLRGGDVQPQHRGEAYRQGTHSNRGVARRRTCRTTRRWRRPEPSSARSTSTSAIYSMRAIRARTTGYITLRTSCTIRTKHSTIRAQLLFASGDKYLGRKLAETERALQAAFLYLRRSSGPGSIRRRQGGHQGDHQGCLDLEPGISFGRSGGTNDTRFNLEDTNFLGWGKSLQVSHGSNVDRTSSTVAWTDPNVFGSRWMSEACLLGFERRFEPGVAGRASLLLAGRTLERANYRRQIRPNGLPLQSGQHRRSIQRQPDIVRAERRRLRRPGRRLDQAAHVRHALRSQSISAHARDLPAGEGAAAGPHAVLSLRRLRHSSGQVQEGRR